MVVCAFDAHNTTQISQMSDRAVRAVYSHAYLGCAVHGLRAETMCALTILGQHSREYPYLGSLLATQIWTSSGTAFTDVHQLETFVHCKGDDDEEDDFFGRMGIIDDESGDCGGESGTCVAAGHAKVEFKVTEASTHGWGDTSWIQVTTYGELCYGIINSGATFVWLQLIIALFRVIRSAMPRSSPMICT
jgi:hypothetical protein